jgi:hypothetical protein
MTEADAVRLRSEGGAHAAPPSPRLPGWFVLDVMRADMGRTQNWVALTVDIDPNDREAWRLRKGRSCRIRIVGKHGNRDTGWNALEDMMATRH